MLLLASPTSPLLRIAAGYMLVRGAKTWRPNCNKLSNALLPHPWNQRFRPSFIVLVVRERLCEQFFLKLGLGI